MKSLRKSIDAKCKDCLYDPECGGGTWRQQIAKCSSIGCPLWPVRPAPRPGSPLADCPRDPQGVSKEWLSRAVDDAKWMLGDGL